LNIKPANLTGGDKPVDRTPFRPHYQKGGKNVVSRARDGQRLNRLGGRKGSCVLGLPMPAGHRRGSRRSRMRRGGRRPRGASSAERRWVPGENIVFPAAGRPAVVRVAFSSSLDQEGGKGQKGAGGSHGATRLAKGRG